MNSNSLDRTENFIRNKEVDRLPFHPILMKFAAKYAGVNYSDFCLDPEVKTAANIKTAEAFGSDWVNVMSDPYAEAESFGLKVNYPIDDQPIRQGPVLKEIDDINRLALPSVRSHNRTRSRIREIEIYKRIVGEKFFIAGWVEGPLAEYCILRDMSDALMDLYYHPGPVEKAMDIITEFSLNFITEQIRAGAHCIGIGDAACSLVPPDIYNQFIFNRERLLVEHIHAGGAIAKLHICGNTSAILPDMIRTGADIIDVDHLVSRMSDFLPFLSPQQVFSGNSDPVSVIMNGTPGEIRKSVIDCHAQTGGRGIVSAGCEIPGQTPYDNMIAYRDIAHTVLNINNS